MYERQWVLTSYVGMHTLILHHFTWLHNTWFDINTQTHCLFTKNANDPASGQDISIHQQQTSLGSVYPWNHLAFCSRAHIPHAHGWAYQHCFTPSYMCSFIYIAGMIEKRREFITSTVEWCLSCVISWRPCSLIANTILCLLLHTYIHFCHLDGMSQEAQDHCLCTWPRMSTIDK